MKLIYDRVRLLLGRNSCPFRLLWPAAIFGVVLIHLNENQINAVTAVLRLVT